MNGSNTVQRADTTGRAGRQERILWMHLRARGLGGCTFRRQHSLGPYLADFYCPGSRLIVEVDGRRRLDPEQRAADRQRTRNLEQSGLRVLRFTHEQVEAHLFVVLKTIDYYLNLPPPLPVRSPCLRACATEGATSP